jgi:nucleoside-diphosphate-sugar epimerase
MNPKHQKVFNKVDILDAQGLVATFDAFRPQLCIHLASTTDLDEIAGMEKYRANIDGVANIISGIKAVGSVKKCIFTSTKLVCKTDYKPMSYDDYCPDTTYGRSKVAGELLVKSADLGGCSWCIARPTSIWGPWSMLPHIPYGRFFSLISRGLYFHPDNFDAPKSFGYVENTVFQIGKILEASFDLFHRQTFYLADYEPFTVRQWADLISLRTRGRPVRTIPTAVARGLGLLGDLAKQLGVKEPPLTSFRLRNMRANTAGVPLDKTISVTGPLPYTLETGVDRTVNWMRLNGFIH